MKIILAMDSFKGCLSSEEVEETFALALEAQGAEVVSVPMSDGGEGMLEAFIAALHGETVEASVHDPLMRPIRARYGRTADGTAVIETAQACGLTLMSASERNPLIATTYGVGELIAHAVKQGSRSFIIGLGGSGTSDAGKGMLQALADHFTAHQKIEELPESCLKECRFTLASDVRNPLCGPQGAAHVFGPQKGASPEMVRLLDERAQCFAQESARRMGKDCAGEAGAGAAGGLGYAFLQYFHTRMQSGADLLLDLIHFDQLLQDTHLVITGEGHADRQTLMGKLPERVLCRARKQQIPVWLIAGQADDAQRLLESGFARVDSITPAEMKLSVALQPETAKRNICTWVAHAVKTQVLSNINS